MVRAAVNGKGLEPGPRVARDDLGVDRIQRLIGVARIQLRLEPLVFLQGLFGVHQLQLQLIVFHGKLIVGVLKVAVIVPVGEEELDLIRRSGKRILHRRDQ